MLYREQHYLKIDTLCYRSTAEKGWYPDALIPFLNPITGKDLAGAKDDANPYTIPAIYFIILQNPRNNVILKIYDNLG
jgi:hypothetical protein